MSALPALESYPNNIPASISGDHDGQIGHLINNLHNYLQYYISPREGSAPSTFIGTRVLAGGRTDDSPVPIMVHCPWPAKDHRHGIIYLKPSVPDNDFCSAVNEMFDMINNGMVCLKPKIEWMDFNPYHDAQLAARMGVSDYPKIMPTDEQDFRMIGITMNGIFSMHVIAPLEAALVCTGCNRTVEEDPWFRDELRQSLRGVVTTCKDCCQRGLFASEA